MNYFQGNRPKKSTYYDKRCQMSNVKFRFRYDKLTYMKYFKMYSKSLIKKYCQN